MLQAFGCMQCMFCWMQAHLPLANQVDLQAILKYEAKQWISESASERVEDWDSCFTEVPICLDFNLYKYPRMKEGITYRD